MTEQAKGSRKRDPLPEAGKRVVVRASRAILIADDLDNETVKAVQKIIREKDKSDRSGLVVSTVWEELGVADGDKPETIAHYAGEKDSPDAKPGLYRSPTLSSWKDGIRYKPPVQRVEAETVE